MEKLVIAGREFSSRLFLGNNGAIYSGFGHRNGNGCHETY